VCVVENNGVYDTIHYVKNRYARIFTSSRIITYLMLGMEVHSRGIVSPRRPRNHQKDSRLLQPARNFHSSQRNVKKIKISALAMEGKEPV